MRPPLLNRLISPTSPAADAATAAFCAAVRSPAVVIPIRCAPNTSCSIGLAIEMTPMPAVTFMHSTPHNSQNCGVFHATFRCTCCAVIIALAEPLAGGVQPAGLQPLGA